MAFSSLADELAGAFDDAPLNDGDGVGLGQSLADEFGLDYGLEHGLEGEGEEQVFDDPSTPPAKPHNLPKLSTPPYENGRRTAKSSYEATNLDDTSPYRGIDELELEYGQAHSFSPLYEEDGLAEELEKYENIDSLPTSPIRNRGIASKASSRSLRVNTKSSVRSLRPQSNCDKEEDIRESLIVLSEGVASNSKLLGSLRHLNHHHHHPVLEDGGMEGGQGGKDHDKEGERAGKNDEDLEIRLQRHLNRMNEVERTREEWNRDLGVWSREAGLGGLEGNVAVNNPDGKLGDLVEEEEDEGDSLGWTGELVLKADLPSPLSTKDNEVPQEQVQEPEHVDPNDLLLLEDELPTHPSDHSLLSPITPSISTTFHTSHNAQQKLPTLIRDVQRDTDLLLIALRNLSDTIHTTTSFHTSISRLMKGIKSSVDSYREREEVEAHARRRIEEWEEERLKIGLTRKTSPENDVGDGWMTVKDRLNRECREFERVLEGYGERLRGLQKGTTRMVSVA